MICHAGGKPGIMAVMNSRTDCRRDNCPGCWDCYGDFYTDPEDDDPAPDPQRRCGHCGELAGGSASAPVDGNGWHAAVTDSQNRRGVIASVPLCHPSQAGRRDCYQEVTVWRRQLGDLR